jgi:hypothetical protein
MGVVDNNFETQGTNLYFVDTTTSSVDEVRKLTCPTSIPGIGGGTKDRIPTDCLDNVSGFHTYIGGLADSAEMTVPFILYKGDLSHQALLALRRSNQTVGWYVGLSDDTADPTIDSDGDLVSDAARTGFSFRGYIANLTFDAEGNEVVRGSVTIQRTTDIVENWAA